MDRLVQWNRWTWGSLHHIVDRQLKDQTMCGKEIPRDAGASVRRREDDVKKVDPGQLCVNCWRSWVAAERAKHGDKRPV